MIKDYLDEKLHEECGVFGVYRRDADLDVVGIACSSDSRSEIVVPIVRDGKVVAVLDIDSDKLNEFDKTDAEYLERLCAILPF